ncbi:MAG: chemotaxis protein CheA [Myxococcaceae bacterium]|nr:chemotaxis protein CheA [Myxococcaceae bacterium]
MAASWDTSRYLTLFAGEATEHLEALGKDVVTFEKGATPEVVDSMFRHAHSVKGMASSMAFEATAKLAHQLEDLLDALRADLARADAQVADVILQTVDALSTHVKAAVANQPLPDSAELGAKLAALHRVLTKKDTPVPAPAPVTSTPARSSPSSPELEAPAPFSSSSSGVVDPTTPPRYSLRLKINPASNQPGVRGFLAYKRLSTLGNVFDLKPPLDDIKAGRVPQGVITLELETDQSEDAVARTMRTVGDVELESIAAVVKTPPAPPVAPEADPSRVVGQEPARTIRVRTEVMDEFLDQAGELLLATSRVRALSRRVPEALRPSLDEAVDHLHLLVKGLHGRVMAARMTPIAVISDRLPRAARDIARRRNREVELVITGEDIELDRAIVDELADPVLHLLRNAIDHGIEPPEERKAANKPPKGKVTLAVTRQRERVVLALSDDGRGIDVARLEQAVVERGLMTVDQVRGLTERERLMLVCLPGLSTATDVTDISGRGVGMDAVKRAVEQVGGTLEIETKPGRGTTFRLALPLTVAMVNLLLVSVGDEVYGLPLGKVSGVIETARERLPMSQNAPVLQFGQSVLPVHELSSLLEVPAGPPSQGQAPFVVVDGDDGRLALAVDRLLGQEEVVLKALSQPLDLVPGLAGVTILGNGRPVFILDVARLVTA